MSYQPFVMSSSLAKRLRRASNASTTAVQLSQAIPQPAVETQASPSPQYTRVPYVFEVISSGAVGYWEMGPYLLGGTDYVPFLGGFAPHIGGVTTFYGYILPFVGGTFGVEINYVAGVNTLLAGDQAVSFAAGSGTAITYFPFAPYEPYFLGSLGFDVDEDFTWEFWIKTTQSPGGAVLLLEQEDAGIYPYRIQLLPSGAVRASRSDGSVTVQVDSVQTVNDDSWHYVAAYKAGVNFGVAVDDNAATTTTDTLVDSTSLTVNGAIAGDGFEGALDEPALYEYALTPTQRLRRLGSIAGEEIPV